MAQDVWEWFWPHWISYVETRILDLTQYQADLMVFRIWGIAMFPFDSVMHECMRLAFDQEHVAC